MALRSAATAAAGSGDRVPLAGRREAARCRLEPQIGFPNGTDARIWTGPPTGARDMLVYEGGPVVKALCQIADTSMSFAG